MQITWKHEYSCPTSSLTFKSNVKRSFFPVSINYDAEFRHKSPPPENILAALENPHTGLPRFLELATSLREDISQCKTCHVRKTRDLGSGVLACEAQDKTMLKVVDTKIKELVKRMGNEAA